MPASVRSEELGFSFHWTPDRYEIPGDDVCHIVTGVLPIRTRITKGMGAVPMSSRSATLTLMVSVDRAGVQVLPRLSPPSVP